MELNGRSNGEICAYPLGENLYMKKLKYWHLYDSFNVVQAAPFIIGIGGSYREDAKYYDDETEDPMLEKDKLPEDFKLVENAIVNALI